MIGSVRYKRVHRPAVVTVLQRMWLSGLSALFRQWYHSSKSTQTPTMIHTATWAKPPLLFLLRSPEDFLKISYGFRSFCGIVVPADQQQNKFRKKEQQRIHFIFCDSCRRLFSSSSSPLQTVPPPPLSHPPRSMPTLPPR